MEEKILEKFTYFINEFKIGAKLDPMTREWTKETLELITFLDKRWNDWCFNEGFFSHGIIFLVEIKVIKVIILRENKFDVGKYQELNEDDLRKIFLAEQKKINSRAISKNVQSKMNKKK